MREILDVVATARLNVILSNEKRRNYPTFSVPPVSRNCPEFNVPCAINVRSNDPYFMQAVLDISQ